MWKEFSIISSLRTFFNAKRSSFTPSEIQRSQRKKTGSEKWSEKQPTEVDGKRLKDYYSVH